MLTPFLTLTFSGCHCLTGWNDFQIVDWLFDMINAYFHWSVTIFEPSIYKKNCGQEQENQQVIAKLWRFSFPKAHTIVFFECVQVPTRDPLSSMCSRIPTWEQWTQELFCARPLGFQSWESQQKQTILNGRTAYFGPLWPKRADICYQTKISQKDNKENFLETQHQSDNRDHNVKWQMSSYEHREGRNNFAIWRITQLVPFVVTNLEVWVKAPWNMFVT